MVTEILGRKKDCNRCVFHVGHNDESPYIHYVAHVRVCDLYKKTTNDVPIILFITNF